MGLFLDVGAGAGAGDELEYDMDRGGVDGPAEDVDMVGCRFQVWQQQGVTFQAGREMTEARWTGYPGSPRTRPEV